jgi:hypothetical protein
LAGQKKRFTKGGIPVQVIDAYMDTLRKLRSPVDEGGFDGMHRDPLHIAAATAIEGLSISLSSQIEISNALRERLVEMERAALALPSPEVEREYRVAWESPGLRHFDSAESKRDAVTIAEIMSQRWRYQNARAEQRIPGGPWEPIS